MPLQTGKAVARAVRQLAYTMRRRPWKLEPPTVVQFPVNDICDSKCQMCNIWQQKRIRQIDASEVRRIFSNPLFRDVQAVGLNGGEPTLRQDLDQLGAALFDSLPRLRSLSLITNGLHADRAITRIDNLAREVQRRGAHLDVMVSLDGVGAVHDRIRGVDGNFRSALRVLQHVSRRGEGVSVRVGCTVIRDNVHHVHELLDYCRQAGVYVKFRLGVANRRLYNLPSPGPKQIGKRSWLDTQPFDLNEGERWHFGNFLLGLARHYEPSMSQQHFYRSLAGQVLRNEPRKAGCDWQHRGITVSSRGEILYCAVQSDVLGNGLDDDPSDLYFGGQRHLAEIIESKCSTCAHDYVGPPGGAAQLKLILDAALRRFGSSLPGVAESRTTQALVSVKKRTWDQVRFLQARAGLLSGTAPPGHAPVSDHGRSRILICGWYGTETLGDKAILASIVRQLHILAPDCQPVIASLDTACTRVTMAQIPELSACGLVSTEDALLLAPTCKAVIFGGGPLMAVREIALMEAIFQRASARRVPTILAGCGVGPLGTWAQNRSIRGLILNASHRIFRDAESQSAAAALTGRRLPDDAVSEDPAACWVASQYRPGEPTSGEGTKILGLGLRDWPFHQYARKLGAITGRRIKTQFDTRLIESLELLLDRSPDLRLLPIPFCTHDTGGDDRLYFWNLLERSGKIRSSTDTGLLSAEQAPSEYVRHIQRADAFLAMRFHSLVFASTLGVPSVAIDYTMGKGKIAALSRRVDCSVHSIEAVGPQQLCDSLVQALESRRGGIESCFRFPAAFRSAWLAATAPP